MKGFTDVSLLDYPRMCRVWKKAPELRHIKCAKYKPGFSKCDTCKIYNYSTKIKKQISEAKRELLDEKHIQHVEEFMLEKKQYYAARTF